MAGKSLGSCQAKIQQTEMDGACVEEGGNDWVKKSMEMTVEGSRGRGTPKITWEKMVERHERGLVRNDAKD